MYKKRKCRHFLFWCLGLELLGTGWMGYRYIDRKVPDEIRVEKGQEVNLEALLAQPFLSFERAVPASGEGSYLLSCRLMGFLPFKEIKVIPSEGDQVMVSGSTVGIYMETEGVLIIDTGEILSESGEFEEPARNIVKSGDYIVGFNDQKVDSKRDLLKDLSQIDGSNVELDLRRNGETISVSVPPVRDARGEYKLGIWVRDDTQGIGTLTYVDSSGNYGALGHGISDVDTGKLLDIHTGELYAAEILGIQKGSRGNPGELSGLIRYDQQNIIGNITVNSRNGVYGKFGWKDSGISLRQMPVGYKQETEIGPASILCCIGDSVEEYAAEITKIDLNHEDTNKSFIIHVTDNRLIEKTGGIVQGMSGSPILQNGKIVGAVTHVFVNDPTRGYAIFIENMLGH